MSQNLTLYIIEATILDESGFTKMHTSLWLNFPFCRLVQRVNEHLTIQLDLDGWGHHIDEYFDSYQERGTIGPWTVREKE